MSWWLCTCIQCGNSWASDYEPPACTCPDGGMWEADRQHGEWAARSQGEDVDKHPPSQTEAHSLG